MAKAKTAKPKKPKKTTAKIDVLIFVFDKGEYVCIETGDHIMPRTGELNLTTAREDAIQACFTEYDQGPIDVYRIQREVPLPVHSVPDQLQMHPEDGPLVTPPRKTKL